MGIVDLISNGFKAVAAFFGYRAQRDGEKNSPTMQANAAASTDATIAKEAAEADDKAAKGDLDEIRKLAGE